MLKKFSAFVAMVAMVLVGVSVSPAQAVNYSANSDSTVNSETVASKQLANGDFSVPVSNLSSIRIVKTWSWKGTRTADVLNKTIRIKVNLTRPNGTVVNDIASTPAFQYYMYSTLFQGFGSENETPAVGDIETTITPSNSDPYDRYNADLYMSVSPEVGTYLATGVYRLTYEVLLNGVAVTGFADTEANDSKFSLPGLVNFEQPWTMSTTHDVQFGTYPSIKVNTKTCLNPSLVVQGDSLTVRKIVDGVVQVSPMNYVSAYAGWSSVSMPNNTFTVDYSHLANGMSFTAQPTYYNAANIGDGTATANNSISEGNHTFEISITKTDGTEVSGPCLPPAPNAPQAGVNGESVTVQNWQGYSYAYLVGCQLFRASDDAPVGNATLVSETVPMGGSYNSIVCQPTGFPRGVPIYAKLFAYAPGLPEWKSYSGPSSTFTVPFLGVTLNTTPSNGTAFGQVKAAVSIDEVSLGAYPHKSARTSEPTGGIFEASSMSNPSDSKTYFKLRRLTSTGVDSAFNNTTFDAAGTGQSMVLGWHGTAAAPKPVLVNSIRNSGQGFTVRDFSSTGAAGDSRTFSNASLNGLCSQNSTFGSGFIFNDTMMVGLLSGPTADVYMQIGCQTPMDQSTGTATYGYVVVKFSLANTAAPTVVTVLGTPTADYPTFITSGSMAGPSGIPTATNPLATGSTALFTFLVVPYKNAYVNWSSTFTYGEAKLVRIAANGTVTTTNANIDLPSSASGIEVSVNLMTGDFGALLLNTSSYNRNGMGGPTSKDFVAGATGGFTLLTFTYDTMTGVNGDGFIFKLIGKTTDGSLLVIRRGGSYNPNTGAITSALAYAKLNATTGAVTTIGETLGYGQSSMYSETDVLPLLGNSSVFVAQDEANPGKLLLVNINGGELPPGGGNNNGGGGGGNVTLPDPIGDGTVELGRSLNSGKTIFVLTGSALNLVTEVWVGGVKAKIKTKATGSIQVEVPAGTNSAAPIVFKYNGGEVTAGVWNYVGAAKVSQTITFSVGGALANYGEPDRTLVATSQNSATQEALPVTITYSSSNTKVCTIVNGNKLHFVAAGTCVVKASQAGSAWLNKKEISSTVVVVKASQSWSSSPATSLSITDVTPGRIEATLDNTEAIIDFTSQTPLICEVDSTGLVTGLLAGTCSVLVSQAGDSRYTAVTPVTVTVTVTADTNPIPDFDGTESDLESPKAIASGSSSSFVPTNDSSFQLSWNKATGKLIPRATGVYLGHIHAKAEFTKNNVNYVCVMSFGNLSKMKVSTAAQKKAAKAGKVFTTKTAFCADSRKLSVPSSLDGKANFAKLKTVSKSTSEKNAEKAAANALKGFTGTVTITVTRYRTWWSTMLNVTGDKANGKKIKATQRITVVSLG